MNISIIRDGKRINVDHFTFPAGEIGFKLPVSFFVGADHVIIEAKIKNSEDLFGLALVKDAVDRLAPMAEVFLVMPYVPYGRQDRVCSAGESFSLKVLGNFINHLNFKRVICADPHSDVTLGVIDRLTVITRIEILMAFDEFKKRLMNEPFVFVSPDAGANKKTFEIAKFFGHSMVRADKLRDIATGEIKETIVYCDDLENQTCVIVDDICDGGKTFIELAKALKAKNAYQVVLYVTHGLFSKGKQVLKDAGIDRIFTTNSLNDVDDDIDVFNLKELMK